MRVPVGVGDREEVEVKLVEQLGESGVRAVAVDELVHQVRERRPREVVTRPQEGHDPDGGLPVRLGGDDALPLYKLGGVLAARDADHEQVAPLLGGADGEGGGHLGCRGELRKVLRNLVVRVVLRRVPADASRCAPPGLGVDQWLHGLWPGGTQLVVLPRRRRHEGAENAGGLRDVHENVEGFVHLWPGQVVPGRSLARRDLLERRGDLCREGHHDQIRGRRRDFAAGRGRLARPRRRTRRVALLFVIRKTPPAARDAGCVERLLGLRGERHRGGVVVGAQR
mmetsp:Transcript_45647/g.151340  ORF Transcript_45647/g.151340 Transcript_45647/m.151340 type:complete len:282 (+) Transcript_45647:2210-3055(+)